MSEVDITEELPNGDDSAFTEEQQQDEDVTHDSDHADVQSISAEHVYVATSQGILSAEQFAENVNSQNQFKTTHIVIHDQTLSVDSGLKTPSTPLPPPTPATPLSREKGLKYQWDDSVHASILPVRCKNTNGELHKAKFGSGGRGRCIKSVDGWFTPNEFEAHSGRASSKDWKRSIRYGGRTLQCLIDDNILQPHATSCTCAACCDDDAVTGPVRLFVPYKRRKKDSESGGGPLSPLPVSSPQLVSKKQRLNSTKTSSSSMIPATLTPVSIGKDQGMMLSIATSQPQSHPIKVTNSEGETVQILTTDGHGNLISGDAVMMTSMPVTPKTPHGSVVSLPDVSEQRQWWQLEEMANNLLSQAQQLKAMVEQAKQQSQLSRDSALQQVKMQCEKEKQEALQQTRLEFQIQMTRALMEERAQKELAVQHALATSRAELQDKIDSVTVVAVDKVTYNDGWVPQQGDQNQIQVEMINGDVVEEEKDKVSIEG